MALNASCQDRLHVVVIKPTCCRSRMDLGDLAPDHRQKGSQPGRRALARRQLDQICLAGGEMRPQLTPSNASQGSQLRLLIPPRLRHATLPVVDRLGRHTHHLRKVSSGETKALASRDQPFGDESSLNRPGFPGGSLV